IESGGQVQTPKCHVDSQSSLQVRGEGANPSKLTVNGELDVQGGTGNMLVENGATVLAQQLLLGGAHADGGVATISGLANDGRPSGLIITGPVDVSGNSSTQLEIKDGALLDTSGNTTIGDNGRKLGVGNVLVHGHTGAVN